MKQTRIITRTAWHPIRQSSAWSILFLLILRGFLLFINGHWFRCILCGEIKQTIIINSAPIARKMVAEWGECSNAPSNFNPALSSLDLIRKLKQSNSQTLHMHKNGQQHTTPQLDTANSLVPKSDNENNSHPVKNIWHDHSSILVSSIKECATNAAYYDVILVCEKQKIVAHRLILAAASEFFKNVFECSTVETATVCIEGITWKILSKCLEYIYTGYTYISLDEFGEMISAGETLKLQGIEDFKRSWLAANEILDDEMKRTGEVDVLGSSKNYDNFKRKSGPTDNYYSDDNLKPDQEVEIDVVAHTNENPTFTIPASKPPIDAEIRSIYSKLDILKNGKWSERYLGDRQTLTEGISLTRKLVDEPSDLSTNKRSKIDCDYRPRSLSGMVNNGRTDQVDVNTGTIPILTTDELVNKPLKDANGSNLQLSNLLMSTADMVRKAKSNDIDNAYKFQMQTDVQDISSRNRADELSIVNILANFGNSSSVSIENTNAPANQPQIPDSYLHTQQEPQIPKTFQGDQRNCNLTAGPNSSRVEIIMDKTKGVSETQSRIVSYEEMEAALDLYQRKLAFHEPRPCPSCARMYRDAATLRTHINIMHSRGDEPILCSCGQSFDTKYEMYHHKKNGHYVNNSK